MHSWQPKKCSTPSETIKPGKDISKNADGLSRESRDNTSDLDLEPDLDLGLDLKPQKRSALETGTNY